MRECAQIYVEWCGELGFLFVSFCFVSFFFFFSRVFFFFSSRRRHTRYWRDWSSDVCSSDLVTTNTREQLISYPERSIFSWHKTSNLSHDLKQRDLFQVSWFATLLLEKEIKHCLGISSCLGNLTLYMLLVFIKNNLDSTCVLIGLKVCFHSAMKHENDVSNMVGCLQVVRIYSFIKEIKNFSSLFLFVTVSSRGKCQFALNNLSISL